MRVDWSEVPFEQCLDRFSVPAKIPKKQFASDGPFPIISQEADFINGYWEDINDVCRIEKPVVIYGDHTQVVKYVDFDFVVGADGVKVLQPKDFIDPKFFYYFVMAHRVPSLGYARHYRHLKVQTVRHPNLEEQRRIVAVLNEAFEGLASARAHAEANLQNARELFDSFLKSSFSEGAETWPSKSLSEIAENLDRRRVPITKKDRVAGEVPYYGASGVVDYVADFIFDEDLLLISEDGANLLARSYPIAFSISGKSWVNNHAHVVRFNDPETQEFVRLYLNSISLEPYVSGMAQPKLNQAALNRIPIPYPDREVRVQIVGKAAELSSATERLADFYGVNSEGFDELRQSLLQKAFSGELT